MRQGQQIWRALPVAAVALLGVAAYLPALNNPFIADDYAYLLLSERLSQDWGALADFPLGGRRLVAHLFFYACYWLFGLHPAAYYAANLLLHLGNAGLVALLVRELTADRRAALVAALFFVVYERHQEPLFWITTNHELLLSLGVLATALFFARFRRTGRGAWYGLALAAFVVSALTKESFLVLLPLLVLVDFALRPAGWGRAQLPFWLLGGGYLVAMFVGPLAYRFAATDSGLSLHFFEVYLRSLHRLLLLVWPFLLLAGVAGRLRSASERLGDVLRQRQFLFFLGWLLVTMVPYSFVLYAGYLSSRHTYIPSVGTAGLVGLLFTWSWEQGAGKKLRGAALVVLAVVLAGNIVHLWRKDAAYLERAAPTEQLIVALNSATAPHQQAGISGERRPVILYDFPYPQIVARGAARFFAPVDPARVFVRDSSQEETLPPGAIVLHWNSAEKSFD